MSTTDYQADLLKVLIASTATFQSVTGTGSVAAARARIIIGEATDEGHDDSDPQKPMRFPRAIITRAGKSTTVVGTGTYSRGGELLVLFQFRAPIANTIAEQEAWFTAVTHDIEDEAMTISVSRATPSGYSTSHLQIRNSTLSDINFERAALDNLPETAESPENTLFDREWRVEY